MDHKGKMFPYATDLASEDITFTSGQKATVHAAVKPGWKIAYPASWWTILAKPYPLIVTAPPLSKEEKFKKTWMAATNVKEAHPLVTGVPAVDWRIEVRNKESGWNDILKGYKKMSMGNGGEWRLLLEKRFSPYHAALTYPLTRTRKNYLTAGDTPKDCTTLTDVLYETYGQKELFELIDYDGLKHRHVGQKPGEPWVWATCAGWGGIPKYLKSKNKEKYFERVLALYYFCSRNKERIDELLKGAKDVAALCDAEAQKNPKLKEFAERIKKTCHHAEELWKEEDDKFVKGVKANIKSKSKYGGRWFLILTEADAESVHLDENLFKKIKAYYEKIYDGGGKAVRSHWTNPGGMLDGIVSGERTIINRIGQEAALSGVHTPEEYALALKIRALVQKTLRKAHYKEGPPSQGFSASKDKR